MPNFDTKRLYSALLNTGLQNTNNALYQVIYQLIGALNGAQDSITTIVGSSGSSGSAVNNYTNIYQQIIQGNREGGGGSSRIVPGPPGVAGAAGATGATLPGPLGIIKHYTEMYPRYVPMQGNQGNPGTTGAQGPMGAVLRSRIIEVSRRNIQIFQGSSAASNPAGLVLLESHTAAASASLDFTTRNAAGQSGATFQSDYKDYQLRITNLVPANNGVGLLYRYSSDGGATWDSTAGHYSWVVGLEYNLGHASFASDSDTKIQIHDNQGNAAKLAITAIVDISDPLSTSLYKLTQWRASPTDSTRTASCLSIFGTGKWLQDVTAANAVQLSLSSGNITSGIACLYGVSK